MNRLPLAIYLWLTVGGSQSASILAFFPMPWKSHHFVHQTVLAALDDRGHHIDYLTAVPMKRPHTNVNHLLIQDTLSQQLSRIHPEDFHQHNAPQVHLTFRNQVTTSLKHVYRNEPAVKELLRSNKTYDLVLSEYQMYQEINAIWAHKFQAIPVSLMVIGEMPFANVLNGLPDNPAYQVDFTTEFTETMDFFERLKNFLGYLGSLLVHWYKLEELQDLADDVARYPGWERRGRLRELASDLALVLQHTHHAAGHSVPKSPHVKEVGGLTLASPSPAHRDLQNFMDSAKDGLVYFSLGSSIDVNAMTRNGKWESFLASFRQMRQKLILKWTGDNMPNINDSKILVGTWFPQHAILANKNTQVFVTHGGMQSTLETIYFGVPIVGIPIYADQPKNIKFMESKGCGVMLDKKNFTSASLLWALNEISGNERYQVAVMKRSALLKDAPMKPLDEAVYWIEYVLKHGRVLQPASVHMPLYQLYLLDVSSFILSVVVISYFLVIGMVKMCLRKVSKNVTIIGRVLFTYILTAVENLSSMKLRSKF